MRFGPAKGEFDWRGESDVRNAIQFQAVLCGWHEIVRKVNVRPSAEYAKAAFEISTVFHSRTSAAVFLGTHWLINLRDG